MEVKWKTRGLGWGVDLEGKNMSSIKLKELFASIQGEGPLVGYKQILLLLAW